MKQKVNFSEQLSGEFCPHLTVPSLSSQLSKESRSPLRCDFLLHRIFLSSRIFLLWLLNWLCSEVSYDLKLKCSKLQGGQELYFEFGISALQKNPWIHPLGDLNACLKIEYSLLMNSQGQDANLHLELSSPLMLFSLLRYLHHRTTLGQISLSSKACQAESLTL